MKLHELKPQHKKMTKKRVGRGPGSGVGKTSKRGQKGQNSRSGGGVRPGFEGGQNPLFRRIPKFGFKNVNYKKYAIINLDQLNSFKDGSVVDHKQLVKSGLIKKNDNLVKILGQGEITKKLTIKAHKFSQSAQKAIEKVGGKIEVL